MASAPKTRPTGASVEAFLDAGARLSLYGLKDLPEGAALLPELGVFAEGAGCVYVRRLDDIDLDVLRRLIRIAWARPDA